jgi:hypothetical protein
MSHIALLAYAQRPRGLRSAPVIFAWADPMQEGCSDRVGVTNREYKNRDGDGLAHDDSGADRGDEAPHFRYGSEPAHASAFHIFLRAWL